MKSARWRGIWLSGLLLVLFLPVVLYAYGEMRDQTSVVDRLVTLTGVQSAGLLAYVAVIGTRFRSKTSEFGVPFHRWLGTGVLALVLLHVLLVVAADPEGAVLILSVVWSPARGVAALASVMCMALAIALGIWRKQSRLTGDRWRLAHVMCAWASGIFALAHILWIDQLVNDPLWLVVFLSILLTALIMWLTKPKGANNVVTGPLPKFAKWAMIIAVVLGVAGVFVLWNNPTAASVGYSQHPLGPVGPSDRDMIFKVKQAGLWEMPVAEEVSGKGTTQELRDIAQRIAIEHHELDRRVTEVATELGVQLPSDPTPDQQRWMSEISGTPSGVEYDRLAVYYLRMAHGKVLPVLSQVRAGSRNELVRQFADESYDYVNRHVNYLESTGLVDFSRLPESPPPSPYQQPEVASLFDAYDSRTLIVGGAAVTIIAVLLTMMVFSLMKSDGKPKLPNNAKNTASNASNTEGTARKLKVASAGRHRSS